MKKFTRVMLVVDWLVAVAFGITVLVLLWQADPQTGETLVRLSPLVATLGAAAILLLNVVWVVLGIRGVSKERYVQMDARGGRIRTAISAIDESLTRSAIAQPEVSGARVRVELAGDGRTPARIVANVSFVETPNQVAAQQVLQNTLLERFKEILPLEEDIPVDISVVRFATEKKSAGEKKVRSEARPRGTSVLDEGHEEFRGPRYPVGG